MPIDVVKWCPLTLLFLKREREGWANGTQHYTGYLWPLGSPTVPLAYSCSQQWLSSVARHFTLYATLVPLHLLFPLHEILVTDIHLASSFTASRIWLNITFSGFLSYLILKLREEEWGEWSVFPLLLFLFFYHLTLSYIPYVFFIYYPLLYNIRSLRVEFLPIFFTAQYPGLLEFHT